MREATTIVKVDNQGRLRLPPAIREALGIEDGGLVEIVVKRIDENRE